jgi:hypothetical protein
MFSQIQKPMDKDWTVTDSDSMLEIDSGFDDLEELEGAELIQEESSNNMPAQIEPQTMCNANTIQQLLHQRPQRIGKWQSPGKP